MIDVKKLVTQTLARTKLEMRPYQQRLITKAVLAFLSPGDGGKGLRSVMIESACGSGKTSIMLCIIKILQKLDPELETAWVCMRPGLLTQASKENDAKGINAKVTFLSMFTKELPEALIANLPDGTPNPKAAKRRLLCLDEGQHDAANTMASIHSKVQANYILACTATPYRSDHVKLCFDTILKDAGLGALIKDGYLSPYNHYTIPDWDINSVCNFYLNDTKRWGKSIFYWHRLEHAHQANQIMLDAGIKTEMVMGGHDKEDKLTRFRTGETQVLHNCMVLIEGFNCEDIHTVWCKPSCKSVTVQMAGRAFRRHPDVPVKNVVQSQRGWPFIKLAEPLEQLKWDNDTWVSLKVNKRIDALSCKMLVILANTSLAMPAYMMKKALSAPGRSRRNGGRNRRST